LPLRKESREIVLFLDQLLQNIRPFFLGNYNLLGSDNEGNVAAGGNADFSGSGVGFGLTGTCNKNSFHGGPETIVVGGNVNMSHGEIYNGDTVIGGQNFVIQTKSISTNTVMFMFPLILLISIVHLTF